MPDDDQDLSREKIVNRLQRIEGQVRGVRRMLQEDRDPVDTLVQISSVMAATRRMAATLASHYLREISHEASELDEQTRERLDEIFQAYGNIR